MRLYFIFIITILFSFGSANASEWFNIDKQFKYSKNQIPPCGYGTNTDGPTIGFIGDSWLDYGKGYCGSAEQFFSKVFDSSSFVNSAQGGATLTGNKKRDIPKQTLPSKPDILILSGGGNDLMKCGNNKSCLNNTLTKVISPDATQGSLINIINKWSKPNTKIIYIYTTEVPYAPNKIKKALKTGIMDVLAERVIRLETSNPNFKSINLANVTDINDRNLWTEDGFHFSPLSYHEFSSEAQAFLSTEENIDNAKADINSDSTDLEDERCSYAIDKGGIDDQGNPNKNRASMGYIIIKSPNSKGEQHIVFDQMDGYGDQNKIKAETNIWFDTSHELKGWIKPFTSRKAKHMMHVAADSPTYHIIEKISKYEGIYAFPDNDPKWQNIYELLIFDCDKSSSVNSTNGFIEIDAIDIDGQKNESSYQPIKLSLKIGLPEGQGPFPTVVILHGSGNMQDTDKELGQHLVNHGIAWIGVYSYDSRGLKWLTYKERLTKSNIFDQVSDAYRVLDYIENDARFDENNVAVTGFSLGGMSSLMTASQSMTEQFKIGKKDFSFALNQYGPCFVSPSDPKPDYRVFSLWGENDASTPGKLCQQHIDYQIDKGMSGEHEFLANTTHGWFRANDKIVVSADSNFSCFIEMTANEIKLKNKTYKNKDELSLMKIIQKPCKHREAVINKRNVDAQLRAVELLVNALK